MKIDISEILSSRISCLDFDFTTSFTEEMQRYNMISDTIVFEENGISIKGKIQNIGGYFYLESNVRVKYVTQCDRCLDEVKCELNFKFNRSVCASDSGPREDEYSSDILFDESDYDYVYVRDNMLDLTGPLTEAIALEIPTYHLCDDECPGLCPECGKKRSDPSCKCTEKKEIDPRLAILKNLLDNSD